MDIMGGIQSPNNHPFVLPLPWYQQILTQGILFSHFLFYLVLSPYMRIYNDILINPLREPQKEDCYEHLSLPELITSQRRHFYSKNTAESQ